MPIDALALVGAAVINGGRFSIIHYVMTGFSLFMSNKTDSGVNEQIDSISLPPTADPDVTMGGQAVLEGVMMRGPKSYAVAVRRPQGNIEMISHAFVPIIKRKKWLQFPIIRGTVSLVEMLLLGYRALDYSANVAEQAAQDLEAAEKAEEKAPEKSNPERAISRLTMTGVFVFSMALAMLLFVALPNVATHLIGIVLFQGPETSVAIAADVPSTAADQKLAPSNSSRLSSGKQSPGLVEEQRPITYNLISGMVRVLIIVGYIFLISLMKDVRRLFQYHGAEHKVVMAYEKKLPLDLEHIRPVTTLHPRCGTTFIAVVLLVSIVLFALLAAPITHLFPSFGSMSIWARKPILIMMHIAFMPIVAGIAYEITRRAGRRPDFLPYHLLLLPGFAFQRITTREPDDSMIEVALASFNEALEPKLITNYE